MIACVSFFHVACSILFRQDRFINVLVRHDIFPGFLPLEDKTIFVFDGNKEGISRYVTYPIATGMVLNFDNDCPELTYILAEQERPKKGIIIPAFPFVADEDSNYPALLDSL